MAYAHLPESKDSIGLKLRCVRCLDIVEFDADGQPVVDLVEIQFGEGVWLGFTPDRRRAFFAVEHANPPVVVQADGSLKGAPGVTIRRKRVRTPQHMKHRSDHDHTA